MRNSVVHTKSVEALMKCSKGDDPPHEAFVKKGRKEGRRKKNDRMKGKRKEERKKG